MRDRRHDDVAGLLSVASMRLRRSLAVGGAPHPEVGANVRASRGRRRLDQHGYAALVGLPLHHVASLESGHRPIEHVPRRVLDLDTDLDWGTGAPGGPGAERPERRHPSAWAHR